VTRLPSLRIGGEQQFTSNPARASPLLQALFPPGVSAAQLLSPGLPEMLMSAEIAGLDNAWPKRTREFAAGRLCVRRAAADLGMAGFALPVGGDRAPQWPAGLAGSITHTDGFCGAVVTETRRYSALGLDAEVLGRATAEVWPQICSPSELAWLENLPEPDQAAATLLFAAKEAFFKCQYALTREWLEFDAVVVRFAGLGGQHGTFSVQPRQSLALARHAAAPYPGHFRIDGGLVFAGMAITA
jgi:4'-phosphopantetheinyl transferase EntD